MIHSCSLDDLHPLVAAKARELIARCEAAGIDLLVISTYRDQESQAKLYAQGRTAPGKIVTNVKPGQSFHNWRVAFDVVPLQHGKPVWNTSCQWGPMAANRRLGIVGGPGMGWAVAEIPGAGAFPVYGWVDVGRVASGYHRVIQSDRVLRLFMLKIGLVLGAKLFIKSRKTRAIVGLKGIFMAEIPVVAQPFHIVWAVLPCDPLFQQQGLVATGQLGGKSQHARVSRSVYLAE